MTNTVKPSINTQKEIIGLRKLIKSTWSIPVSDAQVEKFLNNALKVVKENLPELAMKSEQYGLFSIVEQKKQSSRFNDGDTPVFHLYAHLQTHLTSVYILGQIPIQNAKKTFYETFEEEVKAWGDLKVVSGASLSGDLQHNGKEELTIEMTWDKKILKGLEGFKNFNELREIFMSEVFYHLASVVAYEQEKALHTEIEVLDAQLQKMSGHLKGVTALDVQLVKSWQHPILKDFLQYLDTYDFGVFQTKEQIAKEKAEKHAKEKAGITQEDTNDFMAAMTGVKPLAVKSDTKSGGFGKKL